MAYVDPEAAKYDAAARAASAYRGESAYIPPGATAARTVPPAAPPVVQPKPVQYQSPGLQAQPEMARTGHWIPPTPPPGWPTPRPMPIPTIPPMTQPQGPAMITAPTEDAYHQYLQQRIAAARAAQTGTAPGVAVTPGVGKPDQVMPTGWHQSAIPQYQVDSTGQWLMGPDGRISPNARSFIDQPPRPGQPSPWGQPAPGPIGWPAPQPPRLDYQPPRQQLQANMGLVGTPWEGRQPVPVTNPAARQADGGIRGYPFPTYNGPPPAPNAGPLGQQSMGGGQQINIGDIIRRLMSVMQPRTYNNMTPTGNAMLDSTLGALGVNPQDYRFNQQNLFPTGPNPAMIWRGGF